MVWGNENGGLAHIIAKHVGKGKDFETEVETFAKIEDVLKNGKLIQNGQLRYVVSDDGYRVAIRKGYNGEQKNWVVSAIDYNRTKKEKGITTNPTSASHGAKGSELAAPNNSIGKDKQSSSNKQEKDKKMAKSESQDGVLGKAVAVSGLTRLRGCAGEVLEERVRPAARALHDGRGSCRQGDSGYAGRL